MEVLFGNKITDYINKLPQEEQTGILSVIKPLKAKTKSEIEQLKETSVLSEEEEPVIYGYYMGDSKYALFGFRDKKTLVIVDIVRLVDKKIEFSALTPPETLNEE